VLQDVLWKDMATSSDWTQLHAIGWQMQDIWQQRNDLEWLRKRLRARDDKRRAAMVGWCMLKSC